MIELFAFVAKQLSGHDGRQKFVVVRDLFGPGAPAKPRGITRQDVAAIWNR